MTTSPKHIDYERLYREVPLFDSLSESEIDEVLDISRLLRVETNTRLVVEGQSGTGMYVVVEGRCEVTTAQASGTETFIANLVRGDIIGELNLIDAAPHSATVTTLEPTTLFHINADAFATLRHANSQAAYKILRAVAPIVCERLRLINERIAGLLAAPEVALSELTTTEVER